MQYFHFDSFETACVENNDLAARKTILFFLFSPLFSLQVLWEKNLKILSGPLFSKIVVDIPDIRLSWLLTSLDEVEHPSCEAWANHRDVLAWHLQDGQVNTLLPRWILLSSSLLGSWSIDLRSSWSCLCRWLEMWMDHQWWCTSSEDNLLDPSPRHHGPCQVC